MTRDSSPRVSRPARRLTALLVAVSATGIWFGTGGPVEAAPTQGPAAEHAAVPGELLVGYRIGATPEQRANARSRAAAQLQDRVVPADGLRAEVELVRIPNGSDRSAAARKLEEDPAVAYAEPNYVLTHAATSNDPYYVDGRLWGMKGGSGATPGPGQYGSQADKAWAANHVGSRSVFVGVIDEGIQFTHPDLDANVWINPFDTANGIDDDGNGYKDDTRGWDFASNDNSIYDGGRKGNADDHGTHVAGTIGAEANNGAGVVGVNWNVTMISGKFLGPSGGSIANAIKAVDYFTDLKTRHGLDIVATNNSWGGGGFSQSMMDAISRANTANILFVAAAGNSGTNNDSTPSYPSGYEVPNVIAVAAIDKNGNLASFSQYGATKVDLGAPGVDVWSTTALNGYSSYNGTSMATPHVTGAAALFKASNPGATAAQVKSAILSSATPTPSLAGKTLTGGRLNASGF